MRLVKTNIIDKEINTIPSIPVITFVKYKLTSKMAIITLINLSIEPIFFFIAVSIFFKGGSLYFVSE